MSTPYLRTNQRTSRVVVAPRSREATRPANAVRPRLGSTYCGRTLRRSDTEGGARKRREFYRRASPAIARLRSPAAILGRWPRIDFHAPSIEVARALIGASVFVDGVGGRIVETEAYDQSDPASHTFAGKTPRNAVMFGAPGPGLCLSLLRHALVPELRLHAGRPRRRRADPRPRADAGIERMRERRGLDDLRLLCSGPGRLCQALGVTHAQNGLRLDRAPFRLVPRAEDDLRRRRRRRAHRHQQVARAALALRARRLALPEQADARRLQPRRIAGTRRIATMTIEIAKEARKQAVASIER